MRHSLPNSRIMVHQPSGGAQGQATDIQIQAEEIIKIKKQVNGLYVKHTGQPLEFISKILYLHTDYYYYRICILYFDNNILFRFQHGTRQIHEPHGSQSIWPDRHSSRTSPETSRARYSRKTAGGGWKCLVILLGFLEQYHLSHFQINYYLTYLYFYQENNFFEQ